MNSSVVSHLSAMRGATLDAPTDTPCAAFDDAWHAILEAIQVHDAAMTPFVVHVAAPTARVTALVEGVSVDHATCWSDGSASMATLGVAFEVPASASSEVDFVKRALNEAFDALTAHGVDAPPLRAVGGFSFSATRTLDGTLWEPFGRGSMILPRWTYHRSASATLSFAWFPSLGPLDRGLVRDDLRVIWDRLECDEPPTRSTTGAKWSGAADSGAWCELVTAVTGSIARGAFEKVVVARHREAELPADFSPTEAFEKLCTRFADCTAFLIAKGDAQFLGATPELLVQKRGDRVVSEALAGSASRADAANLLQSEKERREHRLVVDAIVETLGARAEWVRAANEPVLRELEHVVHIRTPIEAKVDVRLHVLDLVAELHPTPAVGGVPAARALEWIDEFEVVPRGWYAAPIGWVDASGDGEFVVALRSGVCRRGRAWLYAGAGVMRDSDPRAEFGETEFKMRALWSAIRGQHE